VHTLRFGSEVADRFAKRGLADFGAPSPLTIVSTNDRYRRNLVIAGRSGECRFTQPIAAVRAWRPELVFMPVFGPFVGDWLLPVYL
jgi:hypothetical protein